jgi:DNA-directed RNA polymerase specialized sigma24 family protein
VLFDHYFEGLKFSEISERTGEPKGTLQARAYNARRRLKGYFIDILDSNV